MTLIILFFFCFTWYLFFLFETLSDHFQIVNVVKNISSGKKKKRRQEQVYK